MNIDYFLAQTGLFDQLNLDRQKLFYLFQDVEDSYHSHIPYHNAIHATDVLQAVYHAINKGIVYHFPLVNYYYHIQIVLFLCKRVPTPIKVITW